MSNIETPHFDRSKFIRQKEALTKWKDNKYRGVLNLTMRFGKTLCAKYAIEHFHRNIGSSDFKTLCIVPTEATLNNAKKVFGELENVTIVSINRFHNIIKDFNNDDEIHDYIESIDLLIIDEIHKFLSKDNIILPYIPIIKRILGLTGSTLTKAQSELLIKYRIPIVDIIKEDDAIANGWVSKYSEYNLAIPLEDHYKVSYMKASELIAETLDMFKNTHKILNNDYFKRIIFNSDFDVVMSCFIGKYYRHSDGSAIFIKPDILRNMIAEIRGWTKDMIADNDFNKQRIAYWQPDIIYDRCKSFKKLVKSRNDILICNRNKLNAVIDIINTNSVSTICFNESTEMADLEYDYFKDEGIIFHSNVESRFVINPDTGKYYCTKSGDPKKIGKTTLKRLAIEGMKNGTYKYIFTAKSLNEGITIENIRQVIITGGDLNSQTHEQRAARGKSIDYTDFTKNCIIINLYIDDFYIGDKFIKSRDKEKLIRRQGTRTNIKWVNAISDIFN